jgi:hypothetical protein
VVLEEKIVKIFFIYYNTRKNSFPYCGPTQPQGGMISTNMILYYVKKLSCKVKLFRHGGSGEEDF